MLSWARTEEALGMYKMWKHNLYLEIVLLQTSRGNWGYISMADEGRIETQAKRSA